MERVFDMLNFSQIRDTPAPTWSKLRIELGEDDGIYTRMTSMIVYDETNGGAINYITTMQVRILRQQPTWLSLTEHETNIQAFTWAIELLLLEKTFSTPDPCPPMTPPPTNFAAA